MAYNQEGRAMGKDLASPLLLVSLTLPWSCGWKAKVLHHDHHIEKQTLAGGF